MSEVQDLLKPTDLDHEPTEGCVDICFFGEICNGNPTDIKTVATLFNTLVENNGGDLDQASALMVKYTEGKISLIEIENIIANKNEDPSPVLSPTEQKIKDMLVLSEEQKTSITLQQEATRAGIFASGETGPNSGVFEIVEAADGSIDLQDQAGGGNLLDQFSDDQIDGEGTYTRAEYSEFIQGLQEGYQISLESVSDTGEILGYTYYERNLDDGLVYSWMVIAPRSEQVTEDEQEEQIETEERIDTEEQIITNELSEQQEITAVTGITEAKASSNQQEQQREEQEEQREERKEQKGRQIKISATQSSSIRSSNQPSSEVQVKGSVETSTKPSIELDQKNSSDEATVDNIAGETSPKTFSESLFQTDTEESTAKASSPSVTAQNKSNILKLSAQPQSTEISTQPETPPSIDADPEITGPDTLYIEEGPEDSEPKKAIATKTELKVDAQTTQITTERSPVVTTEQTSSITTEQYNTEPTIQETSTTQEQIQRLASNTEAAPVNQELTTNLQYSAEQTEEVQISTAKSATIRSTSLFNTLAAAHGFAINRQSSPEQNVNIETPDIYKEAEQSVTTAPIEKQTVSAKAEAKSETGIFGITLNENFAPEIKPSIEITTQTAKEQPSVQTTSESVKAFEQGMRTELTRQTIERNSGISLVETSQPVISSPEASVLSQFTGGIVQEKTKILATLKESLSALVGLKAEPRSPIIIAPRAELGLNLESRSSERRGRYNQAGRNSSSDQNEELRPDLAKRPKASKTIGAVNKLAA